MGWINLASTRYRLEREGRLAVAQWEAGVLPAWPGLIAAALCCDDALWARLTRALEAELASLDARAAWRELPIAHALGLVCLRELAGAPADELGARYRQLARIHPRGLLGWLGHPERHALRCLLARLAEPPRARPLGRPQRGSIRNYRRWLRALPSAPTWNALDQALSPDHPCWPALCRLVLPLAALVARESDPFETDGLTTLRYGASPADREVIFERWSPPRPWQTVPDEDDPTTWFSFDAVELRRREGVFCYLFLNAPGRELPRGPLPVHFLVEQEYSWRLVETQLPVETWRRVEAHRAAGRVWTMLVYDEARVRSPNGLVRIAQRHGLRMATRDVNQV